MRAVQVGEELLQYLLSSSCCVLQHVHLTDARLSTAGIGPIIAKLQAVPTLKCLDLSGASLGSESLHHLSSLSTLQRLTLRRCRTTDAQALSIAKLTSLVALSLSDSNITDIGVRALMALTQLTRLHLAGDCYTGGLAAPRLKRGASRQALRGNTAAYAQTPITVHPSQQTGVSNPTSGSADLLNTGHTGIEGQWWCQLQRLCHLELEGRQLAGACHEIAASLTQLTALKLESRSIGDSSVVCIAGLPRLRSLEIHGASFSGRGVRALIQVCTTLEHLELWWCQIPSADS